ncbi:MAG: hypothetical protein WC846_01535 [Candidatus Gracilibacteria bacterium]|jgi:hypothetical protein
MPRETLSTQSTATENSEKCRISEKTRADLENLKEKVQSSMGPSETSLYINGYPVLSYEALESEPAESGISPKKYLESIESIIQTPDDVFAVMNPKNKIVEWKRSEKDKLDLLMDAGVTLASGGYDCDNMAWLAKTLLDSLGCKNGYDYKARVIGSSAEKHAVCIYTNQDGEMCSIDQFDHHKNIKTICQASNLFKCNEFLEVYLYEKNGIKSQIKVVPINKDLKETAETELVVLVHNKYIEGFNPNNILPSGWGRYSVVQIDFVEGDTSLLYKNGKMDQRSFKDGSMEFFDIEGKLTQKTYPASSDIEVELYDDNRRVVQRNFREKKDHPYEIEVYNSEGKIIKVQTWTGEERNVP